MSSSRSVNLHICTAANLNLRFFAPVCTQIGRRAQACRLSTTAEWDLMAQQQGLRASILHNDNILCCTPETFIVGWVMLKSARAARSSTPEDTGTKTGMTPIRADGLLPVSRAGSVSWLWHLLLPKHLKLRWHYELRMSYVSAVNQQRSQAVSQSCLCHVSYNSSYKILLELRKYVTSDVNTQVGRLKVAAKILCNEITQNFISTLILTYNKRFHLYFYVSICLISCGKPNEKHKRP